MTILFSDRNLPNPLGPTPPLTGDERARLEALERENAKLRRINQVLMDRVERSMDVQGGAFSLFQTAIVLEQKVRERTLEVERALRELEDSHRDLARAKELADTMRTRLSEAIESVNEGFAIFDADDRLVLCNSKYLALWPEIRDRIMPGVRFKDIAELAASSRSVADAYPRPDLWLAQRLAQHRELKGPYIYRLSDGRWIQVNERRTRDGGVVGVYTDITDIKEHETRRRERELAEKSALLQATLDNIAQGVGVYDRDQRLVAWNERFAALLRLPDSVARRGASFAEFILHHAAMGEAGLSLRALMAPSCLVEQPWLDDTVLEISRNPMPGGGFVLTFTDITERKRAEQALRDSEQRIRLVTDAVPALIAYVDAEQRFRFVNKAYENWFNRAREDIEGQPMWAALGDLYYEARRAYILRALAGEEVTFELDLPGENGSPRYAVATYIPHFGEKRAGGKREVLGYFGLIHDITERRMAAEALADAKDSLERRVVERTAELTRLNEQLQQEIAERIAAEEALRLAKAEAEQANLSKTRFLAAASHDLLQPLNAARLFVSALGDLDQPEPNRGLVDNIDVALASVEDLLSTLLDISKLDAGAVRPEVADFPIQSLLGALATEYAAVARERGLDLRVVGSHAVVRSDIRLLRRILQNFLSNALRYTPACDGAGKVLIGCRRTPEGLRIEVCDTGPGVPADKLDEIFQEFRRLDTPCANERVRGMGLGLAIVDRVARMLDHPITVRSQPGRGSVFAVTVPFGRYARPARTLEAPVRTTTNRLVGIRVLVIDNEPAVLAGMRALLEGWGCTVATAASGDEALRALDTATPDVLFADYHLDNGVIGFTEIARVRERCGTQLPSVLITANRTAEVVEEAQSKGCHVLNKPVKPAQLRAVMTGLLG
ncbi:NahK/ErcS family hybrid sensor histidine kinase/response regulator [Azospirillum rugosum]|uniref:histidine kinase n=1 Tax=Azospirillum rugosum TaxID=416170 RepID=A0ABS4SRF9_9PROT|nr:NahK/ErcS family hybrid sensor histidine kinase/response regulator [Azospirillum rugosum]MBP2295146.1 PAS domain S-box-containing protein [Azospirillum rugosum]MDQ0528520.1 PAS domain S-box-containing protein [Azospirillum rugosum]